MLDIKFQESKLENLETEIRIHSFGNAKLLDLKCNFYYKAKKRDKLSTDHGL